MTGPLLCVVAACLSVGVAALAAAEADDRRFVGSRCGRVALVAIGCAVLAGALGAAALLMLVST